jgi:hypothetical protein
MLRLGKARVSLFSVRRLFDKRKKNTKEMLLPEILCRVGAKRCQPKLKCVSRSEDTGM